LDWKEILKSFVSGSDIKISTMVILLTLTVFVYLGICVFAIFTSYKIPELNTILESLKYVIGIFAVAFTGNAFINR